ncbi:MAG TPA: TPM domain-containing protein [Candidatus Baltobacteraceae bacterium]|nr:TPM domain-containing protein [Candidatus Baltobacteraceae bacterium]
MKRLAFICCWLWSLLAWGEVIPPVPPLYFNDYAHVVPASTADQLNAKLEDFERTSGNQVVVAIYPKMESDSSIDDYTVRVARAWKVGQKIKNNGAVLFVFIQDRQMFIQVGYGLEGALPDALCKQITEYEIKPQFKAGDYAGGLTAGINAILAATKGEYKGNGATVGDARSRHSNGIPPWIIILIIIAFLVLRAMSSTGRRGWLMSSGGWGVWGGGWGGGSGGGGFSSGGGGFSGGGGSFGGGGAGSSW